MKKSTILYLSAFFVFYLTLSIGEKYLGKVYVNKHDEKPKGIFSEFNKQFDSPDSLKSATLDKINFIKIKNCKDYNKIQYSNSDRNSLTIDFQAIRSKAFKRTIQKDTLIIDLENKKYFEVNIGSNKNHRPTLILDNALAYIYINSRDSLTKEYTKIIVDNNSNVQLGGYNGADTVLIGNLNLIGNNNSKIIAFNIKASNIQAKLNESYMEFGGDASCDSLNVELLGLSHIKGTKGREKKSIKDLKVTGDLAFYNKHY